jgi:signal transduction histidine kinase
MEAQEQIERPKILIFDDGDEIVQSQAVLTKQLPFADVEAVRSLVDFRKAVDVTDYDVVILEQTLRSISGVELLVEMKLKDTEPSVLVTSRSVDPYVLATVYNAGCHRCIVKEGRWLDELAPAVRHLLRIRRLERENAKLIAKLTEANCLLSDQNKRLDDFSGTVAHDIRGPLGGINMKLEYICDVYKDDVDERLAKLLTSTFEASKRLLSVVQSMYEFAKIGAKAAKMEMLDLGRLVDEVVQDLNFQSDLDIQINISNLSQVWGNAPLLRKVFINLINNAVKYNDKETIVINIGQGEALLRSLGHFCEFYVEDNGPGIPKEELNDLFVMFRRGQDAEKKCEGTGIGLSVVKQIVELHYGTITVSSQIAKGTKFLFTLPLEEIEIV